jgi:hypothetical protein
MAHISSEPRKVLIAELGECLAQLSRESVTKGRSVRSMELGCHRVSQAAEATSTSKAELR